MKRFFVLLTALFVLASSGAFSESEAYRVSLLADERIYAGPGTEYAFRRTVGEDGVYTIVEETISEDGCLWGRLKSGAGWVRLSDAPMDLSDFQDAAFTIKLPAWVYVYDQPGYDGAYVGNIGENGVYTIVETALDEGLSVWGRLRSGFGWVNLTDYDAQTARPVTVALMDDELYESGAYIFCHADPSEYSVKIAIRANERITDVRFSSLQLGEEFWETDRVFYESAYMTAEVPLVIEVTFWGDMTTFGFDFTDEEGVQRNYLISQSGMDGTVLAYDAPK